MKESPLFSRLKDFFSVVCACIDFYGTTKTESVVDSLRKTIDISMLKNERHNAFLKIDVYGNFRLVCVIVCLIRCFQQAVILVSLVVVEKLNSERSCPMIPKQYSKL